MEGVYTLFEKPRDAVSFDSMRIKIASPEKIRSWSYGEVKKPETINYRSFKPEKDGLFCAKIFGPIKDWECNCGKYKRMKHRGIVCDKCGVEVIQSKVRRERMGHIELAAPVAHIWFLKGVPSRIGTLLDMSLKGLERILYFESYVCVDPGSTDLTEKELVSEEKLRSLQSEYSPGSYKVGIGADAIRELLRKIDIAAKWDEIKAKAKTSASAALKKKYAKQLKVLEAFRKSGNMPEWMIMDVIPVLPPELRPLVPLDGGRFATSDLNDLYRRVINRNNRLKRLIELKAPGVIIRNEMRMLQEAVDALFDNGRRGRAIRGPNKRPLKSLSDMLKGKQGRFRQNLLGKRVDYSGRTVIVVGPELRLHQCGLPKKMALELFKPFIFHKLEGRGAATTIKSAKRLVEKERPEVWDVLDEVIREHPVLLNRAPTLHRLGIQAFDPVLVEGKAIRLHPLVCAAFNADFDGDQMAVHVPLSVEAQVEARVLMMSINNILSPANGKPIAVPSQDMVLGCYWLTKERGGCKGEGKIFGSPEEVRIAFDSEALEVHARIKVRVEGALVQTTVGRVILSEVLPPGMPFANANKLMTKKEMTKLIDTVYRQCGHRETVTFLDKVKDTGFHYATRAGISICVDNMHIPTKKQELLGKAQQEVSEIERQYAEGLITNGERYNKVIDIWAHVTEQIANEMMKELGAGGDPNKAESFNPIFMMADSGARGSSQQIRQLGGMRGLMAKPSGEIIERPIISNFREGLTVLEYFISTHGARKGLSDTALKTADSGYMTRKLVDVAQDVIVFKQDCGTANGITVAAIYDGDEESASLSTRIYGRVSCEQIKDPVTGGVLVEIDDVINEVQARSIENIGVLKLKIRSVLTCEAERGCCANCYGLNLATGLPVKIGEAVGIIAAQSIGEPGTQLTMRTFHVGGVAAATFKQPIIKAKNTGRLVYKEMRTVQDVDGHWVVLNKNSTISIRDKEGLELESHQIVIGSVISVKDGEDVKKGDTVVTWDPYNVPILTEKNGKVELRDMISGITVSNETDKETGKKGMVVTEHKEDLHPQVVIIDEKTKEIKASYSIPVGAHLSVKEGQVITAGTQIAKTPRKVARTKDITGGLPRVAELFEARKPKDSCVIAKIEGVISFGGNVRGKKKVIITHTETGEQVDHLVPMGKHVVVTDGDVVKRGDQITEGPVSPEDLLEACGAQELQEHLVNEVQSVYRVQGVEINDKHIEVIVRQMLRKVKITDPGDADQFLWGDQVDRSNFKRVNAEILANGGKPAEGEPVLLGITKASLETDSFISAASFQDTTRVLTEAATLGRVDYLTGFKENVIMGHLIPAGTGFYHHREAEFEFTVEEPEPIIPEKETFEDDEDAATA